MESAMSANPYEGLTAEQSEQLREFTDALRNDASFRKEAMEKLGFKLPTWLTADKLPEPFGQKVLWHAYKMAPHALAGAGVAAVGSATIAGARAIADKSSLAYSYRNMLKNNPELAEEDSTSTQRAFKTLHRLNPEYAKDPLIAGTFVGNTLRAESLHMGDLNQLVQARRAMAQGPDDFFSKSVNMAGNLEKMRSSVEKGQLEAQKGEREIAQAERQEVQARERTEKHPYEVEQAKAEAVKSRREAMSADIERQRQAMLARDLHQRLQNP